MMITADTIIGNIYKDAKLQKMYEEMSLRSLSESIKINRIESQRVRMRKTSDKGSDIALTLPPGSRLRHGDVILMQDDKMVIVELEPEKVALVELKNIDDSAHREEAIEISIRVGHAIGNLHRPIRVEGKKIYFPIQAESEIEMFERMFSPIADHLNIKSARIVFEPDDEGVGNHVHEH